MKNIKPLCGKPLVYRTIEPLEMVSDIDEVYVATDCDEIEAVVYAGGFKKTKVFRRSKDNAADTSSTESVMLEFLAAVSLPDDTIFILVQATSPFTRAEDFQNALKQIRYENADSLLTCVRTKRFFWNECGTPQNYDYMNRPRRQNFKGVLMENGAFYINTVKNIKTVKNRLSGKITIYEMPEYTGLEIDEQDDWLIAELFIRKYGFAESRDIRLFLCDVDGTLTDAGMYYTENGDEMKKFCTLDGKGMELLRNAGIKTGIITSENTEIVKRRAKKLRVDYLYEGVGNEGKLVAAMEICSKEGISLSETAYIGDDLNCLELLKNVGCAACPANAVTQIMNLPHIIKMSKKGGEGAVREFADHILNLKR